MLKTAVLRAVLAGLMVTSVLAALVGDASSSSAVAPSRGNVATPRLTPGICSSSRPAMKRWRAMPSEMRCATLVAAEAGVAGRRTTNSSPP